MPSNVIMVADLRFYNKLADRPSDARRDDTNVTGLVQAYAHAHSHFSTMHLFYMLSRDKRKD